MPRWILRRADLLRRVGVSAVSIAAASAAVVPLPSGGASSLAPAATSPARILVGAPEPPRPVVVPVRPARIEIPLLRVSAPIVPVGVDADGAMGTPATAHEVAWWDGIPVGAGNALLAGHRDWNKRPGSFYRLQDLKAGDQVFVQGDGQRMEFRVEWVKQVSGDAAAEEILGDVGRPVVTLITCGGVFDRRVRHYQDRIVVRAALFVA